VVYKEDGAQISRPKKNIFYIIVHVTLLFLSK